MNEWIYEWTEWMNKQENECSKVWSKTNQYIYIIDRDDIDESSISVELKLEDEISKVTAVKMAAKIASADIILSANSTVKVCLIIGF